MEPIDMDRSILTCSGLQPMAVVDFSAAGQQGCLLDLDGSSPKNAPTAQVKTRAVNETSSSVANK
jgi:hypothetical protein